MMMRVGIIGVSGYGNIHYNDILDHIKLERMEIVSATIINQDEESEKCEKLKSLGCHLYTDYLEMFQHHSDEMDLCFIPTGIPFHAPMSIAAVEAGVNVYVEKPVAPTVNDLNDMKLAEKKSGKFIAVGFQDIYSKTTQSLKRRLLDNVIGEIKHLRGHCIAGRLRSYYDRNGWAGKIKSKGDFVYDSPFNNAFAHYLNDILFLGGLEFNKSITPTEVTAEMYRVNDIESCDTASILINTKEGPDLGFFTTHACEVDSIQTSKIFGTKGTITWVHGKGYTIEYSNGKIERVEQTPFSRTLIMDALEAKLNGDDALICSLEIAGVHTTVVEKAFNSCDIQTISSNCFKKIEQGDSFRLALVGVEGVLKECVEKGCHISHLNGGWK